MKNTKVRRTFIAVLFFIASCIVIITSTYAWATYHDERINKFDSGDKKNIEVVITGNLNTVMLTPNLQKPREIRVKNQGDVKAFVRVSLKEYLLLFDIDNVDQSGNGLTKDYSASHPTDSIDELDVKTWKKDDYYKDKKRDKIYKSNVSIENDYEFQDKMKRDPYLEKIELSFGDNVFSTVQSNSKTGYWLYNKNYFYYSEPIDNSMDSEILLDKIKLASDADNTMKNGLYMQKYHLESAAVNESVFDLWDIKKDIKDPVYTMMKDQID